MSSVITQTEPAADIWPLPSVSASPRFLPVGDRALTVEFGDAISPALNSQVAALDTALNAAEIGGIVETVPSYRSLLVCYDPMETSFGQLVGDLRQLLAEEAVAPRAVSVAWSVPVVFDPPFAEDLPEVAQFLSLSGEQVIAMFSEREYLVYMVGYAPGLPYLGELVPGLRISRKPTPRPRVPAGAVMIGGAQAAIVPVVVPSAWYTLGHTPLRPFDPTRQDPFLFRAGDRVRFHRVDVAEFTRLAALPVDALLELVRVAA